MSVDSWVSVGGSLVGQVMESVLTTNRKFVSDQVLQPKSNLRREIASRFAGWHLLVCVQDTRTTEEHRLPTICGPPVTEQDIEPQS